MLIKILMLFMAFAYSSQEMDLMTSKVRAKQKTCVSKCHTDVNKILKRLRAKGAVISITSDKNLNCLSAGGKANRSRKVNRDTVFHWASVSKFITGLAAMKLAEEDPKVTLDGDISSYFNKKIRNPNFPNKPITLRHLLSHTSSITESGERWAEIEIPYEKGDPSFDLAKWLKRWLSRSMAQNKNFHKRKAPGKRAEYSNIGFALVAEIVRRMSPQKSFERYVQEKIFKPMKMKSASFDLSKVNKGNLASPYKNRRGRQIKLKQVGVVPFGDGSLRASVPDMAKIIQLMLNMGTYAGQMILSRQSIREMEKSHIKIENGYQGLAIFEDEGLLGHDGSDPGATAMAYYDKSSKAGYLVAINNEVDDEDVWEQVIDRLITESKKNTNYGCP